MKLFLFNGNLLITYCANISDRYIMKKTTDLYFFCIAGLLLMVFSQMAESGNNKYSKEANVKQTKEEKLDLSYFRNLQSPFRMSKVNMLWSKAQKVFSFFKKKCSKLKYFFNVYLTETD